MIYLSDYSSPLGKILIAADELGIVGIWFAGQKHYPYAIDKCERKECKYVSEARRWLDVYFSGAVPDFSLPLHWSDSEFRHTVWEVLLKVPYGKTITYGEIAKIIANKTGKKVSAQAVGGAVGHNPISIVVPCHRVIGADGSLTGYAGGFERKSALLKLEGIETGSANL